MSMFWTTLLSSLILTAATGTALGAALGLTGLIILHYFADGATSLAINAVYVSSIYFKYGKACKNNPNLKLTSN